MKLLNLSFSFNKIFFEEIKVFLTKYQYLLIILFLSLVSMLSFIFFYENKLGLAYNDARSHLDIGRRVVEGLKPGLAQLGSVWLPLPHLLMIPTVWNDFMWHSGLSGALQSMISFIGTGFLIYFFLKKINIGIVGRIIGVLVWTLNLNILYLQSTAMTELLLIATSFAGVYYLFEWQNDDNILTLIKSAFWIMLSTLNRYDGWFLLGWAGLVVLIVTFKKKGYKAAEGTILLFTTLAAVGIGLWFLWNLLIFKDALYFILGPYSAHAQQQQLSQAGNLPTKKNLLFSLQIYLYALSYDTGFFILILSAIGAVLLFLDKKIKLYTKLVLSTLFAPFVFNILALYLGFSVLFIQGISGNTWFNVRYGVMMAPAIAIFVGYLIDKLKNFRIVLIGLLLLVWFLSFLTGDAATIDDARVGSSQVNVTEVASYLASHANNQKGFILISAASHDAIIFSSGLPMSRFIHEGTGEYWISATKSPDRWAKWIIMRTNDNSDQTWKLVSKSSGFKKFELVGHYPFADIYELKSEYWNQLQTQAVFKHQK